MADKNPDDADNKSQFVAELHVPQIIAALHQNALEKCKQLLGSKLLVVNSAIDNSDGTAKLDAAGEHIVVVMPVEADKADESTLNIKVAKDILETYMQWFIGPDAKKQVMGEISPIDDSPATAHIDKPVTKSNDNTVARAAQYMTEHTLPIMSFSQFLHESNALSGMCMNTYSQFLHEAVTSSATSSTTSSDMSSTMSSATSSDVSSSTSALSSDEDGKHAVGYYVPYDLEIKGMKKAKRKDSAHVVFNTLRNKIANFFDNFGITLTAHGIFGSGASVSTSVKDIKDKLRSIFGPIDPDELVRNVQERIDKKFKGSSPHADVKIQDRKTLIADLGSYIDSTQKKMINGADYSLVIKIDQDDPKKKYLSEGAVAGIVKASITGFWKKLKGAKGFGLKFGLGPKDVIYIPNYKDIHKDTEKIRALYQSVPTPNRVQDKINKASDANAAASAIDKLLEPLGKSNQRDDCKRADACYKSWDQFRTDNKIGQQREKLSAVHQGSDQFKKFFKTFIDTYTKVYNQTENKELSESKRACFTVSSADISKMILESMFGSYVLEDDGDSDEPKFRLDTVKIFAKNWFSTSFSSTYANPEVICGTKKHIKEQLVMFKLDSDSAEAFNNEKFKNAIAVYSKKRDMSADVSESLLGADIFSMLFEATSTTPSFSTEIDDPNFKGKLLDVLRASLKEAGAKDIDDKLCVFELRTMSEARSKKRKSSSATSTASSKPEPPKIEITNAYALLFDDEEIVQLDTGDSSSDTFNVKDVERHALYIVPMKKLQYDEPQSERKKLI